MSFESDNPTEPNLMESDFTSLSERAKSALTDLDIAPDLPVYKPIRILISADGLTITISDSGLPAIHGAYTARRIETGQFLYNKIGEDDIRYKNSVYWDGDNWFIYTSTLMQIAYAGDNNEIGFLDVNWTIPLGAVGIAPMPIVTPSDFQTRMLNAYIGINDSGGVGYRALIVANLH